MRRRIAPMIGRLPRRTSKRTPLSPQEWQGVLHLALFGLILAIVLALLLVVHLSDYHLEVGAPSPVTIHAPRSVTYDSEIQSELKRDEAARNEALIVYTTDHELLNKQKAEMHNTLDTIVDIRRDRSLSAAERIAQLQNLPSLPTLSEQLAQQILSFSDSEWRAISERSLNLYDDALRDYDFTIDETDLKAIKERWLPVNARFGSIDGGNETVTYLVGSFLRVNHEIDEESTRRKQNEARQKVPEQTVLIMQGENIIRQGDTVTAQHIEKLRALNLVSPTVSIQQIAGRSLFSVVISLFLCIYLFFYGQPIWQRLRPLYVLGLLIVCTVLVGKLLLPINIISLALAPFAILIAALFGAHIGIVVSALLAMVLGFLAERSFQLALVALTGALAGVFAIRRADRTMTFLKAGLWVVVTVGLTQLALELAKLSTPTPAELTSLFLFSLLSGILSGLVTLGTYNALGRLAGLVTPLQLMELAHPNQPLLRRLMQEAPGTYHHSVVISNLAENAAEAIGADSLLVRVGSYYHDIGKTLRPYFFTDNQHNRTNVHESLDPRTSARLIADHVIEGAKLAREYGLPEQIVDFIVQHHGTTVIKYFYQQALQRDDGANIDDYRYPGPKPQTKETALLMLADGVEATVRSREQAGLLRSVRPDGDEEQHEVETNGRNKGQTIEEVVEQIIQDRVRSGELDESPLTLRDLEIVKQSFVTTLQGIYHPRVEYPSLVKNK